jgi:hypothetical protein
MVGFSQSAMGSRGLEAATKAAFLQDLKARGKISNSIVISELTVGHYANRADIVLANSKLHCFEIKTSRDRLLRLEDQIQSYSGCFDLITVVVATTHLEKVKKSIPDYVGIVEIFGNEIDILFNIVRKAKINKNKTKKGMLGFLPAKDIRSFVSGKPASGKRIDIVSLAERLPEKEIHKNIIEFLKNRYTPSHLAFWDKCKSQITATDLRLLMAWHRNDANDLPQSTGDNPKDIDFEWTVYREIGRSFDSVPTDIREKIELKSNPSTPPRWGPSRDHQSAPADASAN